MTKMDKVLIMAVAIVAILGLFVMNGFHSKSQPVKATLAVKGQVIQTIDLSQIEKMETMQIQGVQGTSRIEIAKNRIRMIESPCPDKICIHRGWIESPGEAIVCVPNAIVIKIEGKDQEIDDVTQ